MRFCLLILLGFILSSFALRAQISDDAASSNQGQSATVDVTANDNVIGLVSSSVDLDPSTSDRDVNFSNASGSFSVDDNGVVTFTPISSFYGSVTIPYSIKYGFGLAEGTANITINVNGRPIAVDDVASTPSGNAVNVDVVANDSDPDGSIDKSTIDLDPSTPAIDNNLSTAQGTFATNPSGKILYTPAAGFSGSASVTYTVQDNLGFASNTATVTITVSNNSPVAADDNASTTEGVAVQIDILSNDTDSDGTLEPMSVDLDPSTPVIESTFTNASGTFSANSSGVVTYTPAVGFNGSASATYTVRDNQATTSNIATITVAVNKKPVANNDNGSTNAGVAVTFNITSNDTDADGTINPASVDIDPATPGTQKSISNAAGSFSVNNSGDLTYTPAGGFTGSASASYTVNDNLGATSNIATISISVNKVNNPPVANADALQGNEGSVITANIVSNDKDSDGSINTATVDLNPLTPALDQSFSITGGTISVDLSGVLTFTPNAGFSGSTSFTYTVQDNDGATSNAATVTIAINKRPVANNDAASTTQGSSVSFNILSNDTDADGTINPASVDLNPSTPALETSLSNSNGTYSVNPSGLLTFTPSSGFGGSASITYTVKDNLGATSNQATITVSVNKKPVATNDAVTIDEDNVAIVNILGNDSDDGSLNTASVDLNPAVTDIQTTRTIASVGTFSVNTSGVLTFTPVSNFNGVASITYTVNDDKGLTSDPATVTIQVNAVNDSPVAVNDSKSTNEDTPITSFNILANDSDPDGGNELNLASVDLNLAEDGIQHSFTSSGIFTVDNNGNLSYSPATNFYGTVTISYTISDKSGAISNVATITITVNPVNDPPIAVSDQATSSGQAVSFSVVSNDIDVDGTVNAATVDLNTGASGIQNTLTVSGQGTYVVNSAGVVTFTPVSNFNGSSIINYTVNDDQGKTSNVATITVLVNLVNQNPVANNDAATTAEDTPVNINILANDTDDGSINKATVDLVPNDPAPNTTYNSGSGIFSVNTQGVVTFTPLANFNGQVTANYTVSDNLNAVSNIATITVTVTSVNDPPVANNDVASVSEGTVATINVVANDTDIDGTVDANTIVVGAASPSTAGTFAVAGGMVTFTPSAHFFGQATTTYTVKDNSGALSNTATITVSVVNVNDPPTFDVIADQQVLRNSGTQTITITGVSSGPGENEALLITATSGNTALIPNPTITYSMATPTIAKLSFTPVTNQSGVAEINVRAVDQGLQEFSRSFKIEVIAVQITSQPDTVAEEGEPYEYRITITQTNINTITVKAITKPTWATLVLDGTSGPRLVGTPPANASRTTSTKIQVVSGSNVLDEQTFNIIVNRRPNVNSISLSTNEDVPIVFQPQKFKDAYTDPDGDPIKELQFTQLPSHGRLLINGQVLQAGDKVPVTAVPSVSYISNQDYVGQDTLHWTASDGLSYSKDNPYISISISPQNDAPIITFMESDTLSYEVGNEVAQYFTPSFEARDVDDDSLVSAEVGINRLTFKAGNDVLEFTNTKNITGVYDNQIGILSLTGKAPVEEYVQAIRSVKYNYVNLTDLILDTRRIYVTLSDGKALSEPKDRIVQLVYKFIKLDIPNGFTPNGDRANDYWKITSPGIEQFSEAEIRVFNKRGQLVFEAKGFENPWDGTRNGEVLPVDTYYYTIDLKYNKIVYRGVVTILR
jgi:gliding motility-associated-like protein